MKIINSLFINNSVIGSYIRWEGGGAIYSDSDIGGVAHIIENCTFIENSAPKSWGGAIKYGSGSLFINRNKFINNSALLGNNIFAGNYDTFNENIFYMNSIHDINASVQEDDILKLFDNTVISSYQVYN